VIGEFGYDQRPVNLPRSLPAGTRTAGRHIACSVLVLNYKHIRYQGIWLYQGKRQFLRVLPTDICWKSTGIRNLV